MSTVVHYIKHWDNDTKGSLSYGIIDDLSKAIEMTKIALRQDVLNDDVAEAYSRSDNELFTITKAELVDSVQSWTGVPKAGF